MSFYLMVVRGRRVVALPAMAATDFGAAVRNLSTHTRKRRLFKSAFRLLQYTGGVRSYFEIVRSPLLGDDGGRWETIVSDMQRLVGSPLARYVVHYPSQERRRRVYVYTEGADAVFVKIEYGSTSNGLENEYSSLQRLENVRRTFSIPKVIGYSAHDDYRMIVMRPIPMRLKPIKRRWDERTFAVRNEIIGLIRYADVDALEWWKNLRDNAVSRRTEGFVNAVGELVAKRHPVGVAHGDFAHSNIFCDDSAVLVADWEAGLLDAPFMLDEVTFRLSTKQSRVRADPVGVLHDLCVAIVKDCDATLARQRVESVLLSIGCLVASGNDEATRMARRVSSADVTRAYELSR